MIENLPPDWALNFSDTLSDYILRVFQELIGPDEPHGPMVLPPPTLPVPLVAECKKAAMVLAAAFRNTSAHQKRLWQMESLISQCTPSVQLSWDVLHYSRRLPRIQTIKTVHKVVDGLHGRYPTVHLTKLTTIIDAHGRIVLWYLPGILTPERQVWYSCYRTDQT
jgi:hypothetical protein